MKKMEKLLDEKFKNNVKEADFFVKGVTENIFNKGELKLFEKDLEREIWLKQKVLNILKAKIENQ